VVEHLPSKHEALSISLNTTKKNRKEKIHDDDRDIQFC
jgi:hypothetical protein